jgi:hypothetical protein
MDTLLPAATGRGSGQRELAEPGRGRGQRGPPIERRAYRIDEYCAAYRISRSAYYNLVAAGKLKPICLAGRQLVTVEEAERAAAGGVDP